MTIVYTYEGQESVPDDKFSKTETAARIALPLAAPLVAFFAIAVFADYTVEECDNCVLRGIAELGHNLGMAGPKVDIAAVRRGETPVWTYQ